MYFYLINALTFQLGWILCVVYHNLEAAIFGMMLYVFNLCIGHKQFLVSMPIAFLGCINDLILYYYEVINFATTPIWLGALWLLFSTTLSGCLQWMNRIAVYWQSLIGAISGTTSYYIGYKLTAISYIYSIEVSCFIHFINWLFLMPFLLKLNVLLRKMYDIKFN